MPGAATNAMDTRQAQRHDPVTLVTAAFLLLADALASTWNPARRAALTDPVRTLARR
jgi:ABC-type lipoprotein release transport system permease subunit